MIGDFLSEKYKKIDKNVRVCFITAILCGILAHIYALTNHLYNYDELWHTPTGFGTGVQMGRWALSVLAWLTKVFFKDVYTIPLINGLISIVMYAVLACVAVNVFKIKDSYYAAVFGAIVTIFPAVVCRMFYMFTTHFYAIGEMLAAVSVFILIRNRDKISAVIVSIALLVFSTAIYQADFVTAVCLVVGALLIDLIEEDIDLKSGIKDSLFYFLYLAVSMILYFVSNKIALKITGLQIMEHGENYDTMGQLSGSQLIEGIMHCYKSFFKMPFKDVYATNPNNIVRITFLLSILVIAYAFIVVMISKKSLSQKILIGLVVVVLPLTINLVYIMAISSGVMYTIMAFDIVFMLLIGVAVLEATGRLLDKEEMVDGNKNVVEGKVNVLNKAYKPINATFAIALIGTILSYIWFANGNYLAEQYTNNHDAAYYQVLMTQIKSIDGYEDGMAVALLGKPDNDSTNSRQSMIGDTFNIGGKMETNVAAYSSWNIMTRVLGFDPLVRDSDEDEEFFKTNPEVMEMPCYPADGSIKIIDGTVVIKFED